MNRNTSGMGLADMHGCNGKECPGLDSGVADIADWYTVYYVNQRRRGEEITESGLGRHAHWGTLANYPAEGTACPLQVVSVPVSWVGNPAVVDTDQVPKVSVVCIHERECMDKFGAACLEMAVVGISCMVPDSYCAEMAMLGSVVADFLWMRAAVSYSFAGHSGVQQMSQTCPVQPWPVSGPVEDLRGKTEHGRPGRLIVDDVRCREGDVGAGVAVG